MYNQGVHTCGFHRSETHNLDLVFMPGANVCPVCAGAEQYARELAEEDKVAREQLSKDAPPRTPMPSDGRTVVMKRLTQEEVAQQRAARATRRRR